MKSLPASTRGRARGFTDQYARACVGENEYLLRSTRALERACRSTRVHMEDWSLLRSIRAGVRVGEDEEFLANSPEARARAREKDNPNQGRTKGANDTFGVTFCLFWRCFHF
jgi:hypothetical protein